eukprot:scaffold37874_cov72-Phaeocystis_antarctica.AAC.4
MQSSVRPRALAPRTAEAPTSHRRRWRGVPRKRASCDCTRRPIPDPGPTALPRPTASDQCPRGRSEQPSCRPARQDMSGRRWAQRRSAGRAAAAGRAAGSGQAGTRRQ